MKRAASPDDFAADPIGRYWLGETQLVWCADRATCGSLHWGDPTERDAHELSRALELARHPSLARGFEVFMDASGIERVGWPAFSQLFAYVRERLAEWRTRIVRQAVVLPEGPTGALLAGMVARLGMPYPMRFFESESDALAWLAWPSVAAVAEASELAAAGRGLTRTVHRLRAWLEVALDDVTLGSAAAALGVAPRTLQRELKAAHTSFIAETHAARVRRAARMLEHTDDKVDAIARAVGCASASRLSALFRQRLGLTPARYRERQRK